MHHDSAGCHHIHDADASLGSDGTENIAAARSVSRNLGAGAFEIARIEYVNRNIFVDGGKQSRRVKHLGAEVCQLRRFVEADLLYRPGGRTQPRISRHHSFDISPYL